MIRPKLFTGVVAVVTVVLLGACGGSAGGGVGKARDLGPVRWRWRPPPGASVGMPAADGDGKA